MSELLEAYKRIRNIKKVARLFHKGNTRVHEMLRKELGVYHLPTFKTNGKLTPEQLVDILKLWREGEQKSTLGRKYGVTPTAITLAIARAIMMEDLMRHRGQPVPDEPIFHRVGKPKKILLPQATLDDIAAENDEALKAIDRYRTRTGDRFPSLTKQLEILRTLGWCKISQ